MGDKSHSLLVRNNEYRQDLYKERNKTKQNKTQRQILENCIILFRVLNE